MLEGKGGAHQLSQGKRMGRAGKLPFSKRSKQSASSPSKSGQRKMGSDVSATSLERYEQCEPWPPGKRQRSTAPPLWKNRSIMHVSHHQE